jgi:hypothetical protein
MFKKKAHFEDARFELHNLLGEKSLVGTPLLVVSQNPPPWLVRCSRKKPGVQLGNKNDLPGSAPADEIIAAL